MTDARTLDISYFRFPFSLPLATSCPYAYLCLHIYIYTVCGKQIVLLLMQFALPISFSLPLLPCSPSLSPIRVLVFLLLFFFVRFLFLFSLPLCDFKSNFKRFASASPEHCIERDTKESNCFGTPKRIVFRKSWSSRLSCVSLANALQRDRCVVRAGVLGVHVTSEAHQDLANPGCSEVLQECWHHHRRCNHGQLSESAG